MFKPFLRKKYCIVRYVEVNPAGSGLIVPDGAGGTYRYSMLPGTERLLKLDAGATRCNVGVIEAVEHDNPDGLKVGDWVLYDQHAAPDWFTRNHAQRLAELYNVYKPNGNPGDLFYLLLASVSVLLERPPIDGEIA